MGTLTTMFKGSPIITKEARDKIKNCDEDVLSKIYHHTNDVIQMILIKEIFKLKNYNMNLILPIEDNNIA